ncbi:drug/metabolite transporter (DMT)-like permease [Kitasatospora gansuensis]|uniref:Drug/metabolite transporter (DMT)-like permease n=1 Tax=Kitasatospora gansuensis TaxID=258050 RepID=A0A7W7S8J5_9ACTN|nr:EamA family transporter [Kitasatospora gansuensis]MBB4945890.1 drug/metabolite transporter (DMT)-like permease [Kitasatospora gansuensis]
MTASQQSPRPNTLPPRDAVPTGAAASPARISAAVWGALAIVYVVWGSTYLAIRIAVETMPPFLSAATRFITAGLLLAGLVAWRQGPAALKVTPRQLGSAGLVGLMLLLGGNGMVVLAERDVPSGLAALLIAVVPLWLVLLRRSSGQRTSRTALAGVLLGLVGLGVLTVPGLSGEVKLTGVLLVMVGTLSWAGGSYLTSKLPMPKNVFATSAYEMIVGGLGCLAVAALRGEPQALDLATVSTRSWLALAALIVFGSLVAFTAYAWLLQNAPLPLVATYAYVNPVVAVLLGWLILSEPLSWPIVLGGAIVVAAVCLVVRTER